MANWVLEECVRGSGRLGGFVTGKLDNYRDWLLTESLNDLDAQHRPPFRELTNLFDPIKVPSLC